MLKYDCEEVPEQHLEAKQINFCLLNLGAGFTLKISVNQDLELIYIDAQ